MYNTITFLTSGLQWQETDCCAPINFKASNSVKSQCSKAHAFLYSFINFLMVNFFLWFCLQYTREVQDLKKIVHHIIYKSMKIFVIHFQYDQPVWIHHQICPDHVRDYWNFWPRLHWMNQTLSWQHLMLLLKDSGASSFFEAQWRCWHQRVA